MLILASKRVYIVLLGAKKSDIGIGRIKWQERIGAIFRDMSGGGFLGSDQGKCLILKNFDVNFGLKTGLYGSFGGQKEPYRNRKSQHGKSE